MNLFGILFWIFVGGCIGAFLMMRYADKRYCSPIWNKQKELRLSELETKMVWERSQQHKYELEVDEIIRNRLGSLGDFGE